MIDPLYRRVLLALAASVLVHVWIAYTVDGDGARRTRTAAAAPLTATLTATATAPAMAMAAPAVVSRETLPAPRTIELPVAARREVLRERLPTPQPLLSAEVHTPVPALPGDPTYYPARSLDVYPKALTALDLAVAGAGRVRATVLIDESGAVNDVREIEASAAAIESAARELLWRTRFTPAAKDGRVVKAQVLVSLDYGTPPAPE